MAFLCSSVGGNYICTMSICLFMTFTKLVICIHNWQIMYCSKITYFLSLCIPFSGTMSLYIFLIISCHFLHVHSSHHTVWCFLALQFIYCFLYQLKEYLFFGYWPSLYLYIYICTIYLYICITLTFITIFKLVLIIFLLTWLICSTYGPRWSFNKNPTP